MYGVDRAARVRGLDELFRGCAKKLMLTKAEALLV